MVPLTTMPKSTTAKSTAAKPPYKLRSAGTKWGIPRHSSEDSTATPASMTEEQPTELKVKVSRLESVKKGIPDKFWGKLHPKALSEGAAGTGVAKPISGGKEPLQKAKTMPVRATERGFQLEVYEQDCKITTTCEFDSGDGWDPGEFEEWIAREIEERAAEAGMSTEDWIASQCGDDEWYSDGFEQGAFDGMSKDDADAKMTQIFRSCRQ
ncbi:uncharacterized protein BJ212DRAFT_74156 [Suillus subaureus]|uniref:Uncharacterized protein n=1 Tax=Suillus subaureus TaxID=48587 RepID=A0A9P7EF07_9AGAM|nr:uncharacterized protein BJ212DRAFT_74156 [Suillus subaureus]KAG1819145.1 hypothetical protein BJ212DRAFT_74156 [Suillus subaureus]